MGRDARKQIEVSSVVKLILVCVVTLGIVLFFGNWYLKGKEFEKDVPVLADVLTHQIKSNELYNYVHDADTAIVYMCASNDEKCRSLEKDLKRLIQKNAWEDHIIYLDLKDVLNISSFYEEISSHYSKEFKLEYPTIIYFEGNSIRNVLSGKDVTKQKVEKFLKGLPLL